MYIIYKKTIYNMDKITSISVEKAGDGCGYVHFGGAQHQPTIDSVELAYEHLERLTEMLMMKKDFINFDEQGE